MIRTPSGTGRQKQSEMTTSSNGLSGFVSGVLFMLGISAGTTLVTHQLHLFTHSRHLRYKPVLFG